MKILQHYKLPSSYDKIVGLIHGFNNKSNASLVKEDEGFWYLYFLFNLSQLVYVGETIHLANRINDHRHDEDLVFHYFAFLRFDLEEECSCLKCNVRDLEGDLIKIFRPFYNNRRIK